MHAIGAGAFAFVTVKWLPPPIEFRARLEAANASADALERYDALAVLADHRLSFLETLQLDTALARVGQPSKSRFETIRLATLSSATIDHLQPPIRVAGLRRRLLIETYTGGLGLQRQELFEATSNLHAFGANAILLSFVAADFISALALGGGRAEADGVIANAVASASALWSKAKGTGAIVIQQSLLDTFPPVFGGFDALASNAPAHLVARLNLALADAAAQAGVLWLDVARASARDGLELWHDPVRWYQGKLEIAPQAAGVYGDLVARLIAAARGKSRKCLVLDLDNTLWGGVIGDDGIEGIELGQGSGVGEAHLALQRYAKTMKERGIVLAVCSKNDATIAEATFRDHPEMLLKREDIAVFTANWQDKATNLRAIAEKLNLGLDSLVFVDDNPAERAHIRQALPEVAVPELPRDPAHYVSCIADAGYFEAVSFTDEDRDRATHYAANINRETLQHQAGDMTTFLKQLEMSVVYGAARPVDISRVTQLINKTNQFNTTTVRRTEDEIKAFAADPANAVLHFRLVDRFGDNGIVSVMVAVPAEGKADALELVNWVMSCRVFGRELEYEALNILVERARARGITTIYADHIKTKKNVVLAGLFERLGFVRDDTTTAPETTRWRLAIDGYAPRSTQIHAKEQA